MRVLLLFLMMLAAGICHADNHWMKMKTQGDKVEQIPPEVVYSYEDELTQLGILTNKRMIALNPINQFAWDFYREERPTATVDAVMLTIATFDLKGNRTGYYPDVIAILFQDHSGLFICDAEELNKMRIQSIISDYLINKSGSVIFRLKDCAGEKLDIEVKTIKTLGYYDTITNRHFDGDVDVLSM